MMIWLKTYSGKNRVYEFQQPKACHCRATITEDDFVIAHGTSKFIKSEKFAALQLQKKSHPDTVFMM